MLGQSGSLKWYQLFVTAAFLVLLPNDGAISSAADGTAVAAAVTATPDVPSVAKPTDAAPGQPTAVDETHALFERDILNQVIRLDRFFGNEKSEDLLKAEYQLRWRNSLRLEQGGRIKVGTTVRANVKLSRINERLRLVVYGENEPEPFSSTLPADPGNPGFDRSSQSLRVVNTELRYGLIQTPSLDIFLGAGVRLILPPEAFVRSRLQYTYKISAKALFHFGETLFVKNEGILGETSEAGLELSINQKTLLRWSNSATISDEIKGLEWGTELSLIRELSPRSGVTLASGVYGNTSIAGAVNNYRVLARYRRNFLRKWLFYELEPQLSWPRRDDGSFPLNHALIFRLEIVFQGHEK
ncbi:MAG: hypothetical protein M0T70_18475 [Geobacteraceae bacterium]|nr:hypothetical protein [Geobacteraceae bacterium]